MNDIFKQCLTDIMQSQQLAADMQRLENAGRRIARPAKSDAERIQELEAALQKIKQIVGGI